MDSQDFARPTKSRIILFGGQGSPNIFSSAASSVARHDARSSSAAAILLSRCHAAFLEDYHSLDQNEKDRLGVDISKFRRAEDFLVDQNPYRYHGLVESTTICLYQLLHYLAELERSDEDFNLWSESVLETTGFCSGLMPAIVVASSRTLKEFIDYGLEAFRLAFWIGCRTVFESLEVCVARKEETSWSLVILGLELPQVKEFLERFQTQTNVCTLRVSAILSAKAISLSGPDHHLYMFREQLEAGIITKFVHVHAWYHAGEQLKKAVAQVLQDIERRKIKLPGQNDLIRLIRSPHDGQIFNNQKPNSESLAEWLIRHMLIDHVDWVPVCQAISAKITEHLKGSSNTEAEITSFGPSTESLLAEIKNQLSDANVSYQDLSSFNSSVVSNGSENGRDDIAIVGMGVNFPMGKDPNELWETLSTGLNAVSEIPDTRFDVSQFHTSEDNHQPRVMPVREGAFIDDPWGFDNSFFNISPREAKSMDPQQRIILSTTQAALDDAGYVGDATHSFQRVSIGCYIGIATGDYADNLKNDIDVFYSPGTLRAFHSGRISYIFKLSGPCMTIDTACSSSLVSVYQACRALQSGDCTTAIAGGANVVTSPDMFLGLSRGHFLSQNGGSKPFDEAADGYGRAEGCGIFILKRLEDAIAENDRIHGVIRGVQVNQSGNSHSITHPHSETQTQLFQRALEKSNIDPASISVVEAHGTGTQAGDTREISSLRSVFEEAHSTANPLIVSSIKGSIGHSEAASGAAGLAKLLLMLHNKQIPKQANLSKLNHQLGDLENAGIIVPRELVPWKSQRSLPRRAMLNNFGAAGSNVALLLEERIEAREVEPEVEDRSAYMFNLSAKSKEAFKISVQNHQDFLVDTSAQFHLKDICYTATARRQIYDHRISISCSSIPDLQEKLAKVALEDNPIGKSDGPVIFVFSGQGSLYYGMGMELMRSSSFFRDSIMHCENVIKGLGFPSLLDFLCKEKQSSPQVDQSGEIIASQCACVALEYSLAKLLMSWNIIPEVLVGHSLGEYAALAVSGAITIEDSLHVVAHRARMMVEECVTNLSSMVACKLSPSKADLLLANDHELSDLSVACRNSDNDCVVAGPLTQLERFQEICSQEGIKSKKLDVPYGFHSSFMDPIVEPLQKLGKHIKWSSPSIPVASNVWGRLLTQEDFQPHYFAAHARQPVRFGDTVRQFVKEGLFHDAICLEIGPHPITLPMIQNAPGTSGYFLAAMQKGKDPWLTLNAVLGHFFRTRNHVNWRQVFETDVKLVDLPRYPLANTSFIVPFVENSQGASGPEESSETYIDTGFKLLPRLLASQSSSEEGSMQFETTMAVLGPLISGHNVGGTAICPASVFHELALEAAHIAMPCSNDELLIVHDMSFVHPLVYDPQEGSRIIRIYLVKNKSNSSTAIDEFKVMVNTVQEDQEFLCCTTSVSKKASSDVKRSLLRDAAIVDRQSRYLEQVSLNTFNTKLLYGTIFKRVVDYSAEYQSLQEFSLAVSNYEGIGSFALPDTSDMDKYMTPPVFTDTLLHTAGFAANVSVHSDDICICGRVESVEVLDKIDYSSVFTVYCTLVDMGDNIILADAYALGPSRQALAVIRGMEFKKLRLSSVQRMFQQAAPNVKTESDVKPESIRLESPPELLESDATTPDSLLNDPLTSATSHQDSRQEIHLTMNNTIGQIYGSANLDNSKSLDALGIDSLMQIEIATKLKDAFPGKGIDQNDILACETLQALEDLLFLKAQPEETKGAVERSANGVPAQNVHKALADSLETVNTDSPTNPLHLHALDSKSLPVYLIHDGSGQADVYSRIRNPERDVFAFFDPDFPRQDSTIPSLEYMAERYASCLSKSQTPSLIIGGWSFGGVVAYQAAQLLAKTGFQVQGLVLIDSPYPRKHEPLPKEIIGHVLRRPISGINDEDLKIVTEFQQNAALLANYEPVDFDGSKHAKIKTVYLRSQDIFDTEAVCGVRYDWLNSQKCRDGAIRGWEALVGDHIEVFPITGNHFQPFTASHVNETSAQFRKACQHLETME